MSKKNKMILMIVGVIIILAMIIGIIWWITSTANKTPLEGSTSKVNQLYSELTEKQSYRFKTTLDDKNEIFYAKKENKAYINTIYQGKKSKFIIKEGNTYFLVDDSKEYYTYHNNEIDLEKIVLQLETIKENQYTQGKEKIEGKEYQYEEYEGVAEFLMKGITTTEEETAKTRFYFMGDQLVYIKTMVGDYQETLKVEISNQVEDEWFEIPSEYKEVTE